MREEKAGLPAARGRHLSRLRRDRCRIGRDICRRKRLPPPGQGKATPGADEAGGGRFSPSFREPVELEIDRVDQHDVVE